MAVIAEIRAALAECEDARYTVGSGASVTPGQVVALSNSAYAVTVTNGAAYETIAVYTKVPRLDVSGIVVPTAGLLPGTKIYFTGTAFTTTAGSNKLVGLVREKANFGDSKVNINFDGTRHIVT